MAAIPQERNAVFLANIPEGVPVESDYEVRTLPLPAAADDELVLETLYLSVDPYLRILMRGGQKVGYATPFQKDGEIESAGVSRVIKAAGDYQVGDVIISSAKWADYNILKANAKIGKLPAGVNPQTFLSAAGLTGLTAYFGLLRVGALETYPKGSTVYVSGAAGATGNAVGQIAKLKGYRVVGSAGSDEKVNWLINDLGFDAAFNYKTSANYADSLRETCPNGIDVYFDNVGGEMLDAVIEVINKRGVIINCGAISLYNSTSAAIGPRVEVALIMKELRMQGFLYFSYEDQAGDAIKEIIQWVTEGKFKDVINLFGETGVPAISRAFINMLTGANVGKMLVKIKDE